MTRKLALLNPLFIFDPAETGWIRRSDFDKALAKWLDSIGLKGESIETVGQPWANIIKICKKEELVPEPKSDKATPIKTQLENVRSKIGLRDNKGKFKK